MPWFGLSPISQYASVSKFCSFFFKLFTSADVAAEKLTELALETSGTKHSGFDTFWKCLSWKSVPESSCAACAIWWDPELGSSLSWLCSDSIHLALIPQRKYIQAQSVVFRIREFSDFLFRIWRSEGQKCDLTPSMPPLKSWQGFGFVATGKPAGPAASTMFFLWFFFSSEPSVVVLMWQLNGS